MSLDLDVLTVLVFGWPDGLKHINLYIYPLPSVAFGLD